LLRDKKASRVAEKNMAAFYKTYFSDCSIFQNKKNYDFNYSANGVIEVINMYKNCVNPKNKEIKKIKHTVSNGITLSANTCFTRHYLFDGYHYKGKYRKINDDANIKSTGLGFSAGFQSRFAKKIVTDLTFSYQFYKAFTPKTYIADPNYLADTSKLNYTFRALYLSIAAAKYKNIGKGILAYGAGIKFGKANKIKNSFSENKDYGKMREDIFKTYNNIGAFVKMDYNYPFAKNLEIFGRVQIGLSTGAINYYYGSSINNILGLENIAIGVCKIL
jgi:hypothetical protein